MTPQDELADKKNRIAAYLDTKNIHGVFLTRLNNFAWITCGAENRVGVTGDVGAATAFISPDKFCIITNNIEAARMRNEELDELDVEVLEYPWHDENARDDILSDLIAGRPAASDTGFTGTTRLDRDFDEIKYSLTAAEIDRYRWLGRNCSLIVEKVCSGVKQEQMENEIAARLAYEAMKMRITPTLLLAGADERLLQYRHPLPTDRKVKECVMVAFGGRRWGLIASLTRIVHFGEPRAAMLKKHNAVCNVDAAFILNTRPGKSAGEILRKGIEAYEAAGYPEEWKLHHQGGPTGYEARDYRAIPSDKRTIRVNQAVAWNPSIAGTKSEDTILSINDSTPEILTPCHQWPMTQYESGGNAVSRPDILTI